jgi:replicative DNA helicase
MQNNANNSQEEDLILNTKLIFYSDKEEKEILGFILLDNKHLEYVESEIDERSFYFDINQKIFSAIIKLLQDGRNADIKTVFYVTESLVPDMAKNDLQEYIERLIDYAAASYSTAKELAIILHQLYLKRKLYEVSNYIKDLVLDSSIDDIQEHIDDAEKKIYQVANESALKQEIKPLDSYAKTLKKKLDIARKNKKEITGVRTNLIDLDQYTGGFQKSDLIILAARPSMGKTALAVTIATNVAKIIQNNNEEKSSLAFFSLEMSGEQIGARIVAMKSGFPVKAINTGRKSENNEVINDSEFVRIVEAFNEVGQLPLYIDDTPAITMPLLRSRARYLKRRYNICAIFIDYLQLLRPSKSHAQGNRVLEIAEITQGLKAIAKELNIPIIALSQLSRAVESRDDKKPQLSDLRESGTIEQDADIVMFLYRESYYLERQEKKVNNYNNTDEVIARDKWVEKYNSVKNIAEIIIAKNRNGPTGSINLFFNKDTMEFSNAASDQLLASKPLTAVDESPFDDISDDIRNIFKK